MVRGRLVENLNHLSAGMRLGNADKWHQLFTNGTSRRQLEFQNLVIALMEDEKLDPLNKLKTELQNWRDVNAHEFPGRPDLVALIPDPKEIDVCKLGAGGVINTDTCNAALKTRRLLVKQIEGTVHEMDCCQHIRNVWINRMAKAVSKFMGTFLKDSLDNISSFLRVSPDLADVIRAFHKEFSLTANCPKGHGELIRSWMIKHHPMKFLIHAERAMGDRQDLICIGACPIYWSQEYCIEFLDERPMMKNGDNILQKNLFTILTSVEIIAVSMFFSIAHLALFMPFRWLAGNTHKPAERNWGPRSMDRAMDMLHNTCDEIRKDPKLIHSRSYMMGLYSDFVEELPEFKEYLEKQSKMKLQKRWRSPTQRPFHSHAC
ncbi:hypothetical protein ACHAWF_017485 [Thalassiosira exigua]